MPRPAAPDRVHRGQNRRMTSGTSSLSAQDVIDRLQLQPHPEGGHFRETWRDAPTEGRGVGTAIHFLLAAGERSHWHRVDADEIWHFHAGAPLVLAASPNDATAPTDRVLGIDLDDDQHPQLRVPAHWWQAAWSLGAWTLVSCTVAPAFEFAGFELADPDFVPGR